MPKEARFQHTTETEPIESTPVANDTESQQERKRAVGRFNTLLLPGSGKTEREEEELSVADDLAKEKT